MNIKQHYCIVTQEEANEARELLVKAGEPIWEDSVAFLVEAYAYDTNILQFNSVSNEWYCTHSDAIPKGADELTYPQFKEMLNAKIKEDGK